MAGIDSEVDMIKTAYGGNPQALNNKDIFHVLAARELINDINAGANQLAASVQTDPNSVAIQQEETLLNNSRAQMIAELAPGIQQKGQRSMQRRAMMGQQPMRQPMQGVAGMPANNMLRAAQGGIIGFDGTNGSQVKDSSFPDLSGDGKITRKDILIGSGVIDKKEGGVIGYAGPDGSSVEQTDSDDIDEFGGMNDLLTALMIAESGGDPTAVSRAGAEGAYQIMPSTAADPGYGVAPMTGSRFDPEASRQFAKQYLQAMLDRYGGDTEAALIAYNAGPGNADKFIDAGRDYEILPQTMQTKPYVENIMGQLEKGVRQPTPGLIASRQMANKGINFLRDARDFATGLFDETEATKERRKEQEEFNRIVRARNEGLGTLKVEDDVTETQEVITPSGMTGDQLTAQLIEMDDSSSTGMTNDQLTAQLIGMDDPSPMSYLQGLGIKQQARKDRFSNMFPGAQEAVDEYSKNKEMGGIGSLRQAGRMQEQQRKRDSEEARRAAKYLLMQGRTNDMLTQLNPAMSFEDIEEVGIEGFAPGGIVGFDGTNGSSVEMSNSEPEKRLLGDGLVEWIKENPVDAVSLGLMAVPGLGLAGAGARLGIKGLGALGKRFGPRALELAKKAVTKPARGIDGRTIVRNNPKTGKFENFRKFDPVRTAGVAGVGLSLGNNLLGGDDTDAIVAEEIIRTAPTSQQKLDSIVDLPRVGRKEAPKKPGLFDNVDTNLLREFLTNAGGQTSTSGALTAGGKGVATELARQQTRGDKVTSDMARNAVLQQQVEATLGAQDARTTQYVAGLLQAFKGVENKPERDSMIAAKLNIPLDKLKDYRKKNNQQVVNAALEVDRDYLQLIARQFGTSSSPAKDPELAALVSQYAK